MNEAEQGTRRERAASGREPLAGAKLPDRKLIIQFVHGSDPERTIFVNMTSCENEGL